MKFLSIKFITLEENPNLVLAVPLSLLNIIANYLVFPDAKKQLESRFKCIDGILNLGFFKSALYTGKVYVPYIPVHDTTVA